MTEQLPDYLQELNSDQLKAAQTLQGPVLIQAGAGSGKTKTVIARIHNLVDHGVPPANILAITFTNKAANELKARLPQGCQQVNASTIHSLCVHILRSFPHLAPFNSRFTIIDTDDQRKVMRMAKDEYLNQLKSQIDQLNVQIQNNLAQPNKDLNEISRMQFRVRDLANMQSLIHDYTIKGLLNYLPNYKQQVHEIHMDDINNQNQIIRDANHRPKVTLSKKDAHDIHHNVNSAAILTSFINYIMSYYQEYLVDHNSMDFDDLLYNAVELLTLAPNDLMILQQAYQYISVDEYQDVSDIQEQLIEMLANTANQNLCVVGDPNQSIYAFRGAKVTNILSFADRYPNAEIISIMKNYRSTQQILDVANDVIDKNPSAYKIEAHLTAIKPDGDLPIIYKLNNAHDEAAKIAKIISTQITHDGKKPSDFAVLYRLNALSRNIEQALTNNNIPYQVVGGQAFYDRSEIKDLIAYLRLIVNHGDDLALTRIINTPSRRIGTKTVTLLGDIAKVQTPKTSMFNIAMQANRVINENGKPLSKTIVEHLNDFCKVINQFNLNQPGTTYAVLKMLMDQFFANYLMRVDATEQSKDSSRLANANQLLEAAKEFDATQPKSQSLGTTLANFIELATLNANPQDQETPDGKVQLMTVHSAKGLEFNTVFVIGLEDGIFPSGYTMDAMRKWKSAYNTPHPKSTPEQEKKQKEYVVNLGNEARGLLEEERRLMYVALTRAKQNLNLFTVKERMVWGHAQNNQESIFLKEIDPKHCKVIKENFTKKSNLLF